MDDFFCLSLADLEGFCSELGVPSVHARALYRYIYKSGGLEPALTPGLPKKLRERLSGTFAAASLPVARFFDSEDDGSRKFVFSLADDQQVEAVLMPETGRVTLCISSQVGCAQGCVFCHTGRMGLKRNLTAGEIVAQVVTASRWMRANPSWSRAHGLPAHGGITNIVFMGMGEPLDNVEATCKALAILTDPFGLHLALRRISVSTAGHLEGLERLVAAFPRVRLAVSVHSPIDQERSKLMPINRRWPLQALFARLRELRPADDVPVMIQYTLMDGVNDSPRHAQGLVDLLKGLPVKVNVIPLNPVAVSRLAEPSREKVFEFCDELHKAGLRVMVRFSKGRDIRAACGQLVV